jgi:hypothetical protein
MGTNISGLGIANAIGFKPRVDGGRRFLPPNIKSSLVSVISTYGKKNTDSDRNTLKDLTGKGNDFKLFNFSFSEASGYGEYKTDFNKNWALEMAAITGNQIVTFNRGDYKAGVFFLKIPTSLKVNVASFTVDVDFKSSKEDAAPYYYYWDTTGKRNQIRLVKGKNVLPTNYASNSTEGTTGSGFHDSFCDIITIKQIPNFEHWLVTDGNNDFIESIKPMSEMLEGSDSYTVISIIHQIELSSNTSLGYTNCINYHTSDKTIYIKNIINNNDNTGIYGYKVSPTLFATIKDILGDKNNISISSSGTRSEVLNGKFSVIGYRTREGSLGELSKIAYAGTIIANRVLTYDEIYQVIEYYNLDRPGEIIKPSMLYDIRKQGITNINHAEFNDELIDYINGYNIKMYNMLWDKQSGIGNYPISFKDYTYLPARGTVEINRDSFVITSNTSTANLLEVNTKTKVLPAYKVKIEGTSTIKEGNLKWRINTTAAVITYIDIFEDGVYDIPATPQTEEAAYSGWCISKYNETVNVKITLLAIDDITDAIVLNGIDNFGKVIDVPIWKDYTICALRKWLYTASVDNGIGVGSLVSKSKVGQDGAFIAEQSFLLNLNKTASYNFGAGNSSLLNDKINEKSFAIQTKYTYGINRQTLSVGSGLDTNTLWFGTVRDNDTRFSYLALWNLMLFPYTMSNFILERQLKKYKLGSLYPDNSFPFRPVVTANGGYNSISYYRESDGNSISIGSYIEKDSTVLISIRTNGIDEVLKVTVDGKEVELYSAGGNYYRYKFVVRNSYPKIDITIQEYVKYDDIVQPYPVIFVLQDKESGKELTYGNYVKVGDIIKVKSVIYYNQYLWSIHGYQIGDDSKIYSYNELINKDIVVTKPLSFSCIKKWLLSTAEPLFVYDPAIFTNNAIKTLGYLPDISGQNRHLKLYNFSYEGMSGKDGYPVVFGKNKTWENIRPENDNWKYDLSSTSITIYKALDTTPLLYTIIRESGGTIKPISIPSFKINVKGLQDGESIRYRYFSIDNPSTYSNIIITKNGKHELPASVPLQSDSTILDVYIGFQVILNNNESVKGLIIEILPDYKDSLYFNGITNTASVLNLDHGGKCLVTKINYKFNQETICIYDQRKNTLEENIKKFALLATQQSDIAYGNGLEGNTYINNVLNNYVKSSELENVEHVATLVSSVVTDSNTNTPLFGRNVSNQHYAQFAMYRTILLPEVPNAADRAILNKWCGLPTGYLPKPEYYWDVTGKSNSDTATRNTIKNLGTAKPVASTSDEDAYSLENKNVAYEGMSGYNGYPVVFGANKTWYSLATKNYEYTLNQNIIHLTHINTGEALQYTYLKNNGVYSSLNRETPSFRLKVTGLDRKVYLYYRYIATSDATKVDTYSIKKDGIYNIPKQYKATDAINDSTIYVGIGIANNDGIVQHDCDIILEILPDYYGLCLDGITNYIKCANIPAFTDYTYIIKYKDFDNPNPNSCIQRKGNIKLGGGAFIHSYISTDNKEFQLSFGKTNGNITNSNTVQYCTKTNYNGITIIPGTNVDDLGITIGKWNFYRKMIFYKLMLWSKSINNTYHINMLRNLINNGGIIDLNDSIFDQTSNE